jgi:hypothetical protein
MVYYFCFGRRIMERIQDQGFLGFHGRPTLADGITGCFPDRDRRASSPKEHNAPTWVGGLLLALCRPGSRRVNIRSPAVLISSGCGMQNAEHHPRKHRWRDLEK